MADWFRDVYEFHRRFAPHLIASTPTVPDAAAAEFRAGLIREEYDEIIRAIFDGDLPRIADGAADLIYVVLGALVTYGIDPRPVWAAVHRANMAKAGGPVRWDGKILKPDGWQPPDVAGLLAAQPPIAFPEPASDAELALINEGHYFAAVRSYQGRTGASLLAACEVMDEPFSSVKGA